MELTVPVETYAAEVFDVINANQFLQDCETSPTEAELTNPCTSYTLGPGGMRISMTPDQVQAMRNRHAALFQEQFGNLTEANPAQILVARPCIVVANKGTHDANYPYRMRLVFDLDPIKTFDFSNGIVSLNEEWCEGFIAKLSEFLDVQIRGCEYVLFAGSFEDKPFSAHLYLYQYAFAASPQNKAIPASVVTAMNQYCYTAGVEIDKSIMSSGLKLPFHDKWIHKTRQWRESGMRIVINSNPFLIDSWQALFQNCDPCVLPDDFVELVTWRAPDPPLVAAPVPAAAGAALQVAEVRAQGDSIEQRLHSLVPQWPLVGWKTKIWKDSHVWIPASCYCPFKEADHSNSGKCFATVSFNGNITIKCKSDQCSGRVIASRAARQTRVDIEEQEAISWMNERWAIIPIIGRSGSMTKKFLQIPEPGEPFRYCNEKDFHMELMPMKFYITAETPSGPKQVLKRYSRVWIQSEQRREYPKGFRKGPSGYVPPGYYNTWRGFNINVINDAADLYTDETPKRVLQEDCSMFIEHLYANVCGGDDDLTNYCLNWMAFMLQYPEIVPEVALVMIGAPGVGKGALVEYLTRIVGDHNYHSPASSKALYNSFNAPIVESFLLFVDEASAAENVEDQDTMKLLLTNKMHSSNEKGKPVRDVPNHIHAIIATNNSWGVAAQAKQRRFQCMTVHPPDDSEQFFNDYFNELNGGGPAALYTLLTRLDLTDWHPRQIVATTTSYRQMYNTMSKVHKWWFDVVKRGSLIENTGLLKGIELGYFDNDGGEDYDPSTWWNMDVPTRLFAVSYREMFNEEISPHALGWGMMEFKAIFPKSHNRRFGRKQIKCRQLDHRQAYKKAFEEHLGVSNKIWEI
jgi:hypothetical protein